MRDVWENVPQEGGGSLERMINSDSEVPKEHLGRNGWMISCLCKEIKHGNGQW